MGTKKLQPGDAIWYEGKAGVFCEPGRIEPFPDGLFLAAIIKIDGERMTVPMHKVTPRPGAGR